MKGLICVLLIMPAWVALALDFDDKHKTAEFIFRAIGATCLVALGMYLGFIFSE